jgi:hypothetical protein
MATVTKTERLERLDRYRLGAANLRAAWAAVPDAAKHFRPAAGKWTAHEVVCHCADSEMNAASRIRYIICEKEPIVLGYDQDAWAVKLDYTGHPAEAALAVVDAVRANTIAMLERLDDTIWDRTATHTESGAYSAEQWLRSYSEHLEVHVRQIERNVEAFRLSTGR